MNSEQRKLFYELHEDRLDNARTFKKPSNKKMWTSITDKYRDQAHFIYELIQNADDAGARNAEFELTESGVIFRHDGTQHFSVTPLSEEGSETAKHGDINAITGVAYSNKEETNKIGKFGVGFKAVFQYTQSPKIYDKYFRFELKDYIVPYEIEEDYPGRFSDETLFYLPFDKENMTPEMAFDQIRSKLINLSYPTLFLKNLGFVKFTTPSEVGSYKTQKELCIRVNDVDVYQVRTIRLNAGINNSETHEEQMYMCTRKKNGYDISICYFVNQDGTIRPKTVPAYCYFPTNEFTGLKFLIQAPFLLTDSREGIQSGNNHNNEMIDGLAKLMTKSLLALRDLGDLNGRRILGTDLVMSLPYDESAFSSHSNASQVSFYPFYAELVRLFKVEQIIPIKDGFIDAQHAYWPGSKNLVAIFTDTQLSQIMKTKGLFWAFEEFSGDEYGKTDHPLGKFIMRIVKGRLTDDTVLRQIDNSFIKSQSYSDLSRLYEWILINQRRLEKARTMEIFLDNHGSPSAAFDTHGKPILYINCKEEPGVKSILPELMNDRNCNKLATAMGIREMNIDDHIENLLQQCEHRNYVHSKMDYLQEFFRYFIRNCPQEKINQFCNRVGTLELFPTINSNGKKTGNKAAKELYFDNELVRHYFKSVSDIAFLDFDKINRQLLQPDIRQLKKFLFKSGVSHLPKVITKQYSENLVGFCHVKPERFPRPKSTQPILYRDVTLDHLEFVIHDIEKNKDFSKSVLLWKVLLKMSSEYIKVHDSRFLYTTSVNWFDDQLQGDCEYFFRSKKSTKFESEARAVLTTSKWICDNNKKFGTPAQIGFNELHREYLNGDENLQELMGFLKMSPQGVHGKENGAKKSIYDQLETDERKLLEHFRESGLSLETILELIEAKNQSARKKQKGNGDTEEISDKDPAKKNVRKTITSTVNDILNLKSNPEKTVRTWSREDDEGEDDYDFRPKVDFERKTRHEKQRAAFAISKIEQQDILTQKIREAKKYTYEWVESLLKLEILDSDNVGSHEVSLFFSKVRKDPDPSASKTLLLEQPATSIPRVIEELSDFPVTLLIGNKQHKTIVEAASIKSYSLHIKLQDPSKLEHIDISSFTGAKIDVKSPAFLQDSLLKSLQKNREKHNWENTQNLREALPANIEFIFGPPGTGKTTALSRNLLDQLLQTKRNPHILCLAPTNKAADVLTRKIMELHSESREFSRWLCRTGSTTDPEIERYEVFKEKKYQLRNNEPAVVITTIARFSYDMLNWDGCNRDIRATDWDYVIVDEASMISLAEILNLIYALKPEKFYIAGDPFQINPVVTAKEWEDENIYSLVRLNSFSSPKPIPYMYPIHKLTTQYRSIPSLGKVYSHLAYDGILEHYRTDESQMKLNIDDWQDLAAINLISYPVSDYESIYRSKRFKGGSSYQVYSALLTYELILNLSLRLLQETADEPITIGVISPYKGQSDLINKLIHSRKLPKNVSINVGTVHSFQGDECDIMFVVFNTPPTISSSQRMFLNKLNIINVAVSRAKEYLFLITPDMKTNGYEHLHCLRKLLNIAHQTKKCKEFSSDEIEERLFGQTHYLENNTFTTSHQNVNVYGLPEKKYEVRMEDSAVDVQIHEETLRPDHLEDQQFYPAFEIKKPKQHVKGHLEEISLFSDQVQGKSSPAVSVKPGVMEKKFENNMRVFSKEYGVGVITKKELEFGRVKLVVQFKSGTEKFSEKGVNDYGEIQPLAG